MATIDLNRIAVFVRVVEHGSFTGAAASLHLPVSSASRSVTNLEGELGVRLLHRTTRKLILTDAGQHFFARMQAVLNEAEEASSAVAGFAGNPRGVVRITATAPFGVSGLPEIVAKVTARYPGVVIDLSLTDRVVDLVGEGIDLAIRGGRLEDSSLVARKIAPSDLGIYASPAYLKRRGKPRNVADLAHHACLRYRGRTGLLPFRLDGPRGVEQVEVTGPVVCDNMLFLRALTLAGAGLALLPQQTAAQDLEAGRLVRVLPRHSVLGAGFYVLWASHKLVPARVAVVRELLIEELVKLA
jgi:DNA-binding transcriptional LysR family regulator